MLWNDVAFVLGSKLCRKILETLGSSGTPLAPLQIAKMANMARSNVSTKLKPLAKKGLVKCINPSTRKWRFYAITARGKRVLKMAKEIR